MNIEIFVHAGNDIRPPRATVKAWWVAPEGHLMHAALTEMEYLDCAQDERDVWILLAALYRKLGEHKNARAVDVTDAGDLPAELLRP